MIKNTCIVDGAAVPQLCISLSVEANGTTLSSLRRFDKIFLAESEANKVQFPLMRRDLSYWDVVSQTWRLPSSPIFVNVGFSSREDRNVTFCIVGLRVCYRSELVLT